MNNAMKTTKRLYTKADKKAAKEYRKARQQARGKQWMATA